MKVLKKFKKSSSEKEELLKSDSKTFTPYESFAALVRTQEEGAAEAPASPRRNRVNRNPVESTTPSNYDSRWVIPVNEMTPGEKIYEGSVKQISHAEWRRCKAVLKFMKENESVYMQVVNNEIHIHQSMRPHPRILSFFGYSKILGHVRLALYEYHDGGSLATLLETSQLSASDILSITCDIGSALIHLHSEGFIHRNLQPSSILMSSTNGPILGDLGFATPLHTNQNLMIESRSWVLDLLPPHRMAPESIIRHEFSYASDIFGFGLLIWTMILGKHPLADWTDEQVKTFAQSGSAFNLTNIDSNLCQIPLRRVLEKSLVPSASQRLKSHELRALLQD